MVLMWLSMTSMTTLQACNSTSGNTAVTDNEQLTAEATPDESVVMGAARTDEYVPLLKGKRVALLSN